ncbi:hypothetical protein C2845_PM15G01140 [Panicum miliaceum]|uniref:Uncharacterized protein n=1 Tax=Panicum miliaceum TaxID=4540 RepID=A0A3L6Q7T1_PANMI|nr:hypothetical protein C2845_PM15G01140 [Panicum miliaceum]
MTGIKHTARRESGGEGSEPPQAGQGPWKEEEEVVQGGTGLDGDLRVYLQNLAAANDVQTYVHSNPFGQPFITDSDPHWDFYSQLGV